MYLRSLAREVVGRLQGAGDAFLDGGVATVVGRQDRVLETAGVFDVDVELAVLTLLGDGDARADGSNVRVEDERHDSAIVGELRAHCALGAASSAVGHTPDRDL